MFSRIELWDLVVSGSFSLAMCGSSTEPKGQPFVLSEIDDSF